MTANGGGSDWTADPDEVGLPLPGGIANRGLVVRVGDTVRRPQRPTSAASQALLQYLERVGFEGAPRFLGVDAQDREVLSFIPGTALTPPYPDWSMTDEALRSVADLLRRYHEAVASFDPSPHAWPKSPSAPFNHGLVSHNDTNLDNVVFRDHRAVAFIDFDLASPGSALWDVASTARLWAPLRSEADIHDARAGQALRRLRLFVDAYGVGSADRATVVEALQLSHDWIYDIVRAGAEHGNAGYAEYWQGGGSRRARRTRDWFATHFEQIARAVDPDAHPATTSSGGNGETAPA